MFKADAEQEDVYSKAVDPVVQSCLHGENGLVFAYGITNAGKTHTIRGNSSAPGVLPRALNDIFCKLAEISDDKNNVTLKVSHLEIYNEQYYDLLVSPPNERWQGRQKLKWRMGQVHNLKHVTVASPEEALEQLTIGTENRTQASTALNSDSSRSHSVFTIVISGLPGVNEPVHLSIVDLAGSERARRTNNGGHQLTEAGNINLSLLKLSECFRTLRWNQQHHVAVAAKEKTARQVPYRDSKLTMIFRKSFQGSGQIVMIVAASTTAADYDETFQVLKKAAVARRVKGEAKSRIQHTNKQYDANGRRRRRRGAENKPTSKLKHRFKHKRRSLSAEPAIGRSNGRNNKTLPAGALSGESGVGGATFQEQSSSFKQRPASLEDPVAALGDGDDVTTTEALFGPPRPIFDKECAADDDLDDDARTEEEIEDEVRQECAQEMEQMLVEQAEELKQVWKARIEEEVGKVMKHQNERLAEMHDLLEVAKVRNFFIF